MGFEPYDESQLPSVKYEWWPPVLPETISLKSIDTNHQTSCAEPDDND